MIAGRAFHVWADGVYKTAHARPDPPARIDPENGGYALNVSRITASGTVGKWEFRRAMWSRNRADVVSAAKLRGFDL